MPDRLLTGSAMLGHKEFRQQQRASTLYRERRAEEQRCRLLDGSDAGPLVEWQRCWTKMSFANSQTTWLEWCIVVHFPTEPPICTTIDVHEDGDIPILMSFPGNEMLGYRFNDIQLRERSTGFRPSEADPVRMITPVTSSLGVLLATFAYAPEDREHSSTYFIPSSCQHI